MQSADEEWLWPSKPLSVFKCVYFVCCWILSICTNCECDSKVDFTVEVEWRRLLASFLLFMFSCFLGWYRTSGEGRAPRGQCPQSAQYSGHHHCELFISSPSAHQASSSVFVLFCSLICLCLISLYALHCSYFHAILARTEVIFC